MAIEAECGCKYDGNQDGSIPVLVLGRTCAEFRRLREAAIQATEAWRRHERQARASAERRAAEQREGE